MKKPQHFWRGFNNNSEIIPDFEGENRTLLSGQFLLVNQCLGLSVTSTNKFRRYPIIKQNDRE